MEVKNSKEMATLLEALGLRRYEWIPTDKTITLNISMQELVYAINSSDESIQYIYGDSNCWKELCNLYGK